jgi:hypothetical protein
MKMKYKDLGSFEFQNLMQTIRAAKTSNVNACRISAIWKQVTAARTQIMEEYTKEIMEVYAKRDENGAIIIPEGQQAGFTPIEDKIEEFTKAQDAFGEKEYTFTCMPFNPSHLSDVKMSAKDIETLGVLFQENAGPGIPASVGF